MSQNLYAQFSGTPMSREDIERLLKNQGYGIVSLCDGDTPYSVPLSFGYDGEAVYLPFLSESRHSRKAELVSEGTIVRLLVTDINGRFDWQSVSVTGPVRSVDPDDEDLWSTVAEVLHRHSEGREYADCEPASGRPPGLTAAERKARETEQRRENNASLGDYG